MTAYKKTTAFCCASDLSEDSYGDVVGDRRYPDNGWTNLFEYNSVNPIMFVNHDKNSPIATAENVHVEGDKLKFKLKFAPAGASMKADECRSLVKCGILRGISVGFISLQSAPRENGGTHHQKMRLMEISLVSIPANSSAYLEAKRLGVSSQTIRKMFKMNNDHATLGERIAVAKENVRRYSVEERAEILRRAKAVLIGHKSTKPLRLPMSDQAREKSDRIARNKAVIVKAKATLARLKRKEYEARRDPLPSSDDPWDNTMCVTWRGEKIRVQKQQWRGEDVIPDSRQKTKWKGRDVT
jgi:HK97 family phage prohead protease